MKIKAILNRLDAGNCGAQVCQEAAATIRRLRNENEDLRLERQILKAKDKLRDVEETAMDPEAKADSSKSCGQYWDNICRLNAKQEIKGKQKYGVVLEDNTTLTTAQRIEHAQEEAIDLLKYLEHLKQVAEDGITANDYQRAALRTAKGMVFGEDKTRSMLMNAALGMAGESGEVADIIKKHTFQGHDLDVNHVAEEIGDVLWYVAVGAEAIGLTLGEVAQRNIDKLQRRYPDGFDKSRSINREDSNG